MYFQNNKGIPTYQSLYFLITWKVFQYSNKVTWATIHEIDEICIRGFQNRPESLTYNIAISDQIDVGRFAIDIGVFVKPRYGAGAVGGISDSTVGGQQF